MSEQIKPKKPTQKQLTVKEAKELLLFMKEQKVASFNFNGFAVNFHPAAFLEEVVLSDKPQRANIKTQPVKDEDYLFDSAE